MASLFPCGRASKLAAVKISMAVRKVRILLQALQAQQKTETGAAV